MASDTKDFGFPPPPPAVPMGAGFAFGYSVAELLFFGAPQLELPPGYDPTQVVNPFPEGSAEGRGFAEGFYDFTQK